MLDSGSNTIDFFRSGLTYTVDLKKFKNQQNKTPIVLMIFTPAEAKMECDNNVRAWGSMVSYKYLEEIQNVTAIE